MDARLASTTFACLIISLAAIAPLVGCAPMVPQAQAQACPPGVPWVPAGYANGKGVPGHCEGQPAQ